MEEKPITDIDPALIFPGPIALVAGPGSGKTSRLALRIKHLVVERKVDPATIAVITFTREAARNMKQRLTPPAKAGMPDVTLFKALRTWLGDRSDNVAFRELLVSVCDSGALDIPTSMAKKTENKQAREKALEKISQLWTATFNSVSLYESLKAAKGDSLLSKLNTIVDELEQATSGTPTDLAKHTFIALKPWSSADRMLKVLATLLSDYQQSQDGDSRVVRIMTMRNSKGLEARTVFVVGLDEGVFPSSVQGTSEFEEEARLFYVSMMRAKESLHLFHARTRSGGRTFKADSFALRKSVFLTGLPADHCEEKYHKSLSKTAAK